MGMYDNFVFNCSSCGKETTSQTKQGDCCLATLEIGSKFPTDGKMKMKNPCEHCSAYNTVIVNDGVIVGFTKEEHAVYEEGYWGDFGKIENEDE